MEFIWIHLQIRLEFASLSKLEHLNCIALIKSGYDALFSYWLQLHKNLFRGSPFVVEAVVLDSNVVASQFGLQSR